MNTFFQSPLGQTTLSIGVSTVSINAGAVNPTFLNTIYSFPLDGSVFTFGTVNLGVGINMPTTGQIWPLGFM